MTIERLTWALVGVSVRLAGWLLNDVKFDLRKTLFGNSQRFGRTSGRDHKLVKNLAACLDVDVRSSVTGGKIRTA